MEAEGQLPGGLRAGRVDGFSWKGFLPGLAGDEERGFICMGNGQENALSAGLFKQVIQNVFGDRPVGLLEALKEYILRGSADWCREVVFCGWVYSAQWMDNLFF